MNIINIPSISVVMSVYKEPLTWIQETIDSILFQTFFDYEFIIINDNPNDDKLQYFLEDNKNKDERIIIVKNEKNIGLTKSLNKGISFARGKYIARMDADDIAFPERFEKQFLFLETHDEIGVLGTGIVYFGTRNGTQLAKPNHHNMYLFLDSCFAHPTVMMRRELFKKFSYDESVRYAQDYDLWERMYSSGIQFANIETPLLKYRFSDIQISTKKSLEQGNIARQIRRRALDSFCKLNNYTSRIGNEKVNFSYISKLMNEINLPDEIRKILLYRLILSIDSNLIQYIHSLFSSKRALNLSIKNIASLLYLKLKGENLYKF